LRGKSGELLRREDFAPLIEMSCSMLPYAGVLRFVDLEPDGFVPLNKYLGQDEGAPPSNAARLSLLPGKIGLSARHALGIMTQLIGVCNWMIEDRGVYNCTLHTGHLLYCPRSNSVKMFDLSGLRKFARGPEGINPLSALDHPMLKRAPPEAFRSGQYSDEDHVVYIVLLCVVNCLLGETNRGGNMTTFDLLHKLPWTARLLVTHIHKGNEWVKTVVNGLLPVHRPQWANMREMYLTVTAAEVLNEMAARPRAR